MKYFNLHTHSIEKELDTISITNNYPNEAIPNNKHYSSGIHPWQVNENWENELEIISERLENTYCLALGECGLDKRVDVSLELQSKAFQAQVELAKQKEKPLILHCAAAFEEVLKVLKEQNFKFPVVFHGFSKNQTVANDLIKKGFYISFGKYLILKDEIQKVFENIDNSHFLLETDNSNFKIEEIYNIASSIKKMSDFELQNTVKQNFTKIFKINFHN